LSILSEVKDLFFSALFLRLGGDYLRPFSPAAKTISTSGAFLRSFFSCPCAYDAPDKRLKQRMRLQRFDLNSGWKLASDEIRMTRNLHHLHVRPVRSRAEIRSPLATIVSSTRD